MSHIKHISLLINGRVQGVGFRYFVSEIAKELGIKGWVKNRNDGSVEVRFEGESKVVKQFVKMIEKGNQFASIEEIEVIELYKRGEYKEFTVRYF